MPASEASDDESLFEPEADSFDYNQLHHLGNQAVALGLILGHGYHGGAYEVLRRGEILQFPPAEAQVYLTTLLQSLEQTDG